MFFNLAQTFYVDKSLVQNADDIIITSVDLYFKSKPKATNNKSGIQDPGVSVLLADVMEDGVPDIKNTYAISDRWAHVEYQNIAVSTTAATKTNFIFTKPIIVQTNKSYAIVVCYDGNEDFILWSAKEGDQILGTNKPAPGSFSKNVGNYYEPVSQPTQATGQEAYDWESAVSGAPGGLTNGIWKPLKDLDLKFNAYCGRFHNSSNSGANTFPGNNFIVKNHHEYVVFDRASSYAIKGGRYNKEGGQSNGIVTVGWRENFKPGELVYQVTPLVPGTISVNSKSRVITSDGSINFNSLYGATANQDLFIVLVSNNYMNADSRNFNSRPKYKYPTGGTFYDPYRSDTDVRKIISIDSNTQITIDNNPTFSDPNARMSVSPVAEFDFFDYHHHKIPDWDVDWWRFDKKRRKRYGTMFLRDSNANSTLRFVNNTIEYVSINTPPVTFNNLFTIANGVSNSSISYDIAYAGNSTFVAVGANQSIQISNDLGVTWTAGSSNSTAATAKLRLYSVAYGNSVYFAVGEKGLIYRSTNALTWTLPTSPQTDSKYTLYGAAYGDGKYVAVGKNKNDSYIINSSDANTWTNRSNSSIEGKLYGVTFGNSVFVAVGDKDFARSIDGGDTWSKISRAAGSDGKFFDVAYGNGVFVAVGKGGIQTSPTGSSWTKRTIAGIDFSPYIFSVAYGNGSFVAVGGKGSKNPGYVLVSNNNGVDWTSRSFPLELAKYRDKQNLAKKIAYGNSVFVAAIMATYREMDDDDDKSYGQFIYANSTAINTRIPGSNTDVGSVTGTGYSNNDRIEIYCTNSVYTVKNAYANVITDGSGSISNTRIYSPGYGFPSDGNGITYKIWNNSNALSSGTGANLHFSIGASLRTEHSGLVYSNVSIVNLEIHKVIPKIRHSYSKHQKDIVFKFNTPWYLDATDDEIKFGNGASHPTPNGGVIISTVANTYLNQTNTLIIMSRSNEIAVQAGLGNNSQNNYTGIGSNSISNNDFSVDVPIDYGIYTGTYDVNNLDAFENTRYGQARAKHISTKVSFAKDQAAEDLVVYMRAHRPVGTDIKVYAKVYNKDDEDAFDDKDWTLLEYKVNGDVFASETNVNDMAEYQLGFRSSPNTYYVGTGVVTTNSSTIIVGTGTDFNGEFNEGDLIKISSPLFPNNYQIAVVNSISNDTFLTLNDPITATGIATGSGLSISFLGGKRPDFIRPLALTPPSVDPSWFTGRPPDIEGYPYQAFNNVNGNNVIRYYNQQMVPFDTFTTFQLKIVMISPNPSVVPMLEDIRAIGVSV